MLKILKKGLTILNSRLKKDKETEEVLRKRAICKGCDYNSKNMELISFDKKILKTLSDFYSLITFNRDKDNLHNCMACQACSIFYKTLDEDKCPHPKGDKWKQKL